MRFFLVLLLGLSFLLSSCSDNSSGTDSNGSETLSLSFTGLEHLDNGYHYEGWVMLDGAPVTTGKFNIDASGNFVDVNGNSITNEFQTPNKDDLTDATAVIITIEPSGDTDEIPATTKIIAGDINGSNATLNTTHGATLGNDFSSASGKYILATPTSADTTDENSGIWFLSLASGSPAVGLDLPTLPAGWVYEGWAVIDGTPVTSGRFTDVAMADLAAPFSSTGDGPPFPGEDYIVNAPSGLSFPTDLAGGTAVISIEPEPDDSAAPFTLKPLVGSIDASATDHFTYDMTNNNGSFPTGTASIK
ncbi:MAG: hypothetical protein D8M58_08305 [Calditrichaeota bacterium]|nr:MAG: hypothetical protein DWQ03_18185 [Calditrichota bacterium]MBL1205384.1 hypothetical protein [Calditrichota bacterium]NOG45213.1 anti-sigma factor [Calditrichota bacterium]